MSRRRKEKHREADVAISIGPGEHYTAQGFDWSLKTPDEQLKALAKELDISDPHDLQFLSGINANLERSGVSDKHPLCLPTDAPPRFYKVCQALVEKGYLNPPLVSTYKANMRKKEVRELAEEMLRCAVEGALPSLVEAGQTAVKRDTVVMMHQDSFAADYQFHEFLLLGMAVKYIGLLGVNLVFIGKNRSTVEV